MSDFRTSSQRERWIFQPHDLMEKWAAANQRAAETLAQYGTTRLKVSELNGSVGSPDHVESSSVVKPLSYEEEQLTRVFYEQKIQEVCSAFKFPHKIQATAIIYFKRFYLQWSVMEHHPKHIMLTCVYTSCKVEENHVSAEELGKGIQQDYQIILNNEILLLKTLDFDLIVYAPYRSIEGFIDDLEGFCRVSNGAFHLLKELHLSAIDHVDKIMLIDAPLLYTPGQLALAALHKSNEALRVFNFERYLETIFSRQRTDCSVEQFVRSITAINYLVDQLNIPDVRDLKHVDRKLKHCWDPSSHDEHKKKEKKSKHKSKRTSTDAQL